MAGHHSNCHHTALVGKHSVLPMLSPVPWGDSLPSGTTSYVTSAHFYSLRYVQAYVQSHTFSPSQVNSYLPAWQALKREPALTSLPTASGEEGLSAHFLMYGYSIPTCPLTKPLRCPTSIENMNERSETNTNRGFEKLNTHHSLPLYGPHLVVHPQQPTHS